MDSEKATVSLAGTRIAVGASSWLTPRLAGRAFGLDTANNPQSPYLARLFGVRDLALGVGALTSTGESRRRWLTLALACDAADAAAGVFAGRAGYLGKLPTAVVTAAALAGVAMGVAALAGDDAPTPA
jgi:hypothetical protein